MQTRTSSELEDKAKKKKKKKSRGSINDWRRRVVFGRVDLYMKWKCASVGTTSMQYPYIRIHMIVNLRLALVSGQKFNLS